VTGYSGTMQAHSIGHPHVHSQAGGSGTPGFGTEKSRLFER
jgi:hypothetical protein